MNQNVNQADIEILKGRRILFVEDRGEVIDFFLEELQEVTEGTVEITRAKTLSEAVREITEAMQKFDLIVIDLHMPSEFPDELKPFADLINPDINEGQTLGLWLHKFHEETPYLYLSSVPEAYRPHPDDTPTEPEPVNKFLESPFDFPKRLAAVLLSCPGRKAR